MSAQAARPAIMTGIAMNAPSKWMRANDLPHGPDDAELHVDEQAGTITVEVFATDADGRTMLHADRVMVTVATFPLKVPPPPGLIEAYQHTVARLRQERNAAEAIRRETAEKIAAHIAAKGIEMMQSATIISDMAVAAGLRSSGYSRLAAAEEDVWDAMGWPRPETRGPFLMAKVEPRQS